MDLRSGLALFQGRGPDPKSKTDHGFQAIKFRLDSVGAEKKGDRRKANYYPSEAFRFFDTSSLGINPVPASIPAFVPATLPMNCRRVLFFLRPSLPSVGNGIQRSATFVSSLFIRELR
jgi:hypothetical protein